jgi:hypothetical protein
VSKADTTHPDTGEYYQDFDRSPGSADYGALAYGVKNTANYLEVCGNSIYANPYLWGAVVDGSSASGLSSSSYGFSWNRLGNNAYQEWGYWTLSNPFVVGTDTYAIAGKGYYMVGEPTPDAALAGFSGTAAYTGNAWGTYYGGHDMTGTFSCDVDFDATAGQISNFGLSVTDGTYSASITGAAGSFQGTSGAFSITGGTWQLQDASSSYTPGETRASGALYGPNAEHVGGAWGMRYDTAQGATGIFQGNK